MAFDSPGKKKRRSPRAPAVIKVDYRTVDRFFMDFAENLSAGGMFIACPNPLEPGTWINLEFMLPESVVPIKVKAEVVWSTYHPRTAGQKRGMGVRFEGLSDADKHKINEIVKKLRACPG